MSLSAVTPFFYVDGPSARHTHDRSQLTVIARFRARAGSLIWFDHKLWHAGELVSTGVRHIMRCGVLYKRRKRAAVDVTPQRAFTPSHQGYVWTLCAIQLNDVAAPKRGIASGGRDQVIRIWDAQGTPLQVLRGHTQSVLGVAVLRGGKLASVSRDRSLKIWNLSTQLCEVSVAAHESAVLSVCASARNRAQTVVTGGADDQVKLWNAMGQHLGTLSGHGGWVWDIAELSQTMTRSPRPLMMQTLP